MYITYVIYDVRFGNYTSYTYVSVYMYFYIYINLFNK